MIPINEIHHLAPEGRRRTAWQTRVERSFGRK
jgi:hypothetical protein